MTPSCVWGGAAREAGEGLSRDGHAIVRANDSWELVLQKQLGKHRLVGLVPSQEQGAAIKGKAAEFVVDRQWVALQLDSRLAMAFIVWGSVRVGLVHRC